VDNNKVKNELKQQQLYHAKHELNCDCILSSNLYKQQCRFSVYWL